MIKSRLQGIEGFFSTSAARFLLRFIKRDTLYISNHDGYHDGAGAQTQRIFSIYCLATSLDRPFLLKPIEKIELQPIDFLTTKTELLAEIALLNDWISRTLSVQAVNDCERTIKITKPIQLPLRLLQLVVLGIFSRRRSMLTFLDGYFAAKVNPQIWENLPTLDQSVRENKPFEIHLHLRLTNFVTGDRTVGKDFFQEILGFIFRELEDKGRCYKVIIHTDFVGHMVSRKLLAEHAVPESLLYWQTLGLIDEELAINADVILKAKNDMNEIASVSVDTQIYVARHWVEEWESMASADLFVMGKSSFSAVGGLLNQNGLVIGPNFWNSGKPNWFTSGDMSELKIWISARL